MFDRYLVELTDRGLIARTRGKLVVIAPKEIRKIFLSRLLGNRLT